MRKGGPGGNLLPGTFLLLLAVAAFLFAAGCGRGVRERSEIPLPPDEREARPAAREPGPAGEEPRIPAEPPSPPAEVSPPPVAEEKPASPETKVEEKGPAELSASAPGGPVPAEAPPVADEPGPDRSPAEPRDRKREAVKRPSPPPAAPENGPAWARNGEELVFRVEFLGMTMGYARFTFKGKAALGGREVYHLNVRAWTSDVLSVIYPINDSIDYYLDVKTLAPLRQEYTKYGRKEKDDIAFYDQEKGKIVYRYKHNGAIRKQVDVLPEVHDPVSVAYYFRTRDLGAEDRPRNVYAGRKLWSISTRTLGMERIEAPGGPVDAVVVQPVIRRDGRQESKGDLKMWMTNDARHVPVKIYAKFRKIKMWTLTAELLPGREGG